MVQMVVPTVEDRVADFTCGFCIIIKIQKNSQLNTRVLKLLPNFQIRKMSR